MGILSKSRLSIVILIKHKNNVYLLTGVLVAPTDHEAFMRIATARTERCFDPTSDLRIFRYIVISTSFCIRTIA